LTTYFDDIFSLEIDISMIFRGHKHILITHLLAAIKYLKDKGHRFGKIKGKGVNVFKLPISNVNNLCCQEAWK
jgi:hypothetical protein